MKPAGPSAYPGDLLVHLESFARLLAQVRRDRRGAFDEAARELGVDRSVLRRRVKTLRDWVGVPLWSGRGAAMRPTAAGLRLADRAERLVESARGLGVELREGGARVVVAGTGTVTTQLLPGILLALEAHARPVQLVVRRAGGAACEGLVRRGEVDVGVVRADEPPRGLASRHLVDDRLWFVVPAAHPLARRRVIGVAEMARVPLVLYGESSRTRARVMSVLGPLGARVRVEVEGRSAALEYVRSGVGATFLSLLPGHRAAADGVHARDVTTSFGPSRFFVIVREGPPSEPVARVVERLEAAVRSRRART